MNKPFLNFLTTFSSLSSKLSIGPLYLAHLALSVVTLHLHRHIWPFIAKWGHFTPTCHMGPLDKPHDDDDDDDGTSATPPPPPRFGGREEVWDNLRRF